MKKNRMNQSCFLLGILISMMAVSSCNPSTHESEEIGQQNASAISSDDQHAACAFLTTDNKENPVLCWVEGEKEETVFCFAVSTNKGKSFDKPVKVLATKGLNAHHESMPKVCFKNDGTIITVFQKRNPTPENRFAGAIYYVQSTDQGNNWSAQKHLYSDTTMGIGRSFFDLTRLPDGEVAAIWLDGRKNYDIGTSLYFAKTEGVNGFTNDIEIAKNTCECCRTDIYLDKHENINVVFRNIFNDSIRDFAHLLSSDLGKTFTQPKRISNDNWIINGCPHTGASMTEISTEEVCELHFVWFTAGGKEGLYHCSSNDHGNTFNQRELVNINARHPQISSLENGTMVLVWDEFINKDKGSNTKIGIQFRNLKSEFKTTYITSEDTNAEFPVVSTIDNNTILVAWAEGEGKNMKIVYKTILVEAL